MADRDYSRDPDDLYGDQKVVTLEISVRRNGSMSVAGDINNLAYALQMLKEAADVIKRHHERGVHIIVPPHLTDVSKMLTS